MGASVHKNLWAREHFSMKCPGCMYQDMYVQPYFLGYFAMDPNGPKPPWAETSVPQLLLGHSVVVQCILSTISSNFDIDM